MSKSEQDCADIVSRKTGSGVNMHRSFQMSARSPFFALLEGCSTKEAKTKLEDVRWYSRKSKKSKRVLLV